MPYDLSLTDRLLRLNVKPCEIMRGGEHKAPLQHITTSWRGGPTLLRDHPFPKRSIISRLK